MAHMVESMAYVGATPWHGLGQRVLGVPSVDEMVKAAGLDWYVSKEQIFLGDGAPVPNRYALVRDRDQKVLDVVGPNYKPVQNADALSFFHRFCEAGAMSMETAGSLKGGRIVWALAKVDDGFALPGSDLGDRVNNYLLLMSPHIICKALLVQFTPVRVVCMNTLNMALSEGLRGSNSGRVFSLPHMQAFNDDMKNRAAEAVGLAQQQMADFRAAAELLAGKRATADRVVSYFADVTRVPVNDDGKPQERKDMLRLATALEQAPGAHERSAQGTWWGALNAVTYMVDHVAGRTRDNGLSSAWVGPGAAMKRRALTLAVDYANAA